MEENAIGNAITALLASDLYKEADGKNRRNAG